jgi:hypothetical protein
LVSFQWLWWSTATLSKRTSLPNPNRWNTRHALRTAHLFGCCTARCKLRLRIMVAGAGLAAELRRITTQRYFAYVALSITAALGFQYTITDQQHLALASFLLLSASIASEAIPALRNSLHISYRLTLCVSMFLLGFVSAHMPAYLFDRQCVTTAQSIALHFTLAFLFLCEVEWVRLRSDLADTSVLYPELINMPVQYHYQTWAAGHRHLRYIDGLPLSWKYQLKDLAFAICFLASNYWLNRGVMRILDVQPTVDNAFATVLGCNVIYVSTRLWPIYFGFILLRPVRLFIALVFACVLEMWEQLVHKK